MKVLNILHLEDDPLDAELTLTHLQEGGIEANITRVDSRAGFLEALEKDTYDLILADYSLPMFDGLAALDILKERGVNLPFILLSGAVGEDVAIESLKSGATDYVLKHRLDRLAPSVKRALREAAEHAQLKQAEENLRASEEFLRRLFESSPDCLKILNIQGQLVEMNLNGMCLMEIDDLEPYRGTTWVDFWPGEGREAALEALAAAQAGGVGHYQGFCQTAKGTPKWWEVTVTPILDVSGMPDRLLCVSRDITERKQAEETLHLRQQEIEDLNKRLQRAMAESHHRIKNNLQVLSALVEMQILNSSGTVPVGELQRLSQHIRTLASLHDLLTLESKTGAEELDIVSLKAVLERLIPMLETASGGRAIVVDAMEARSTLKQASPFILLVNELVSNAIKHGAGKVHIELKLDPSTQDAPEEGQEPEQVQRVRLEVRDDGPGFPADFNPQQAANTGLELIESMGRWDLKGQIHYENRPEGGARVVVLFPVTYP